MMARRLMSPISAMIVAGVLISGCGDANSEMDATRSQDTARLTESVPSDQADMPIPVEDVKPTVEPESATRESSSREADGGSEEAASPTEPEYSYSDEPEAATGVVATLCNLDPTYLSSLRNENSSGEPVVDDDLRLSVLAMSDQIAYWESLEDEYPGTADDIDSAEMILNLWDQALVEQDNGDADAAQSAMVRAEGILASMEGGVAPESAQCVG